MNEDNQQIQLNNNPVQQEQINNYQQQPIVLESLKNNVVQRISDRLFYINRQPMEFFNRFQDYNIEDGQNQNQQNGLFQISHENFQGILIELSLDKEFIGFFDVPKTNKQSVVSNISDKQQNVDINNVNQEKSDSIKQFQQLFGKGYNFYDSLKISMAIGNYREGDQAIFHYNIITQAFLNIIYNSKITVEQLFQQYVQNQITIQVGKGQLQLPVWDFNSFINIFQNYGISNYIDQQSIINIWKIMKVNKQKQQNVLTQVEVNGQKGYITYNQFKNILKIHRDCYVIKQCKCRERDENNNILHDFKKEQGYCQMKIAQRCDVRLKIPDLVKQKLQSQFFFDSESELCQVIGQGYPLYFEFMKYCIIFLVMLFLTSGGYNLLSNASLGDNCEEITTNDEECKLNWITKFSLVNKRFYYELNQLQNIMTLFSILSIIVIFQLLRYTQREMVDRLDKKVTSRSDYTIIVKDIVINELISKQQLEDREYVQNVQKKHSDLIAQNLQNYIEQIIFKKFQVKTDECSKIAKPKILCINLFINEQTSDWQYWAFVTLEKESHKSLLLFKELNKYVPKSFTNQENILINCQNNQMIYYYKCDQKPLILKEDLQNPQIQDQIQGLQKCVVEEADEPEEYIWENFQSSNLKNELKSCLIMTCVILFSFVSIYFVNALQDYLIEKYSPIELSQVTPTNSTNTIINEQFIQNNNDFIHHGHQFINQFLTANSTNTSVNSSSQPKDQSQIQEDSFIVSWAKSIFIFIVTQSVAWTIQFLSYLSSNYIQYANDLEKHTRKTDQIISLTKKNILLQFFNSSLNLFIIYVLIVWFQTDLKQARIMIFKKGGLVYNVTMLLINNALKDPIMSLFSRIYNLFWVTLRIKSGWKYLKYITQSYQPDYTKLTGVTNEDIKNLEEVYLEMTPEYDIVEKYVWIINTMLLTIFYAPLIPMGFFWSILGILLTYKLEKFLIINTSKIQNQLTKELSLQMTEVLEYIVILYCFANFLFEYIVVHGVYTDDQGNTMNFGASSGLNGVFSILTDILFQPPLVIWIGIIIGAIHALLDMQWLNEFLIPLRFSYEEQLSYSEAHYQMIGQKHYSHHFQLYLKKQYEDEQKEKAEELKNNKAQENNKEENKEQDIELQEKLDAVLKYINIQGEDDDNSYEAQQEKLSSIQWPEKQTFELETKKLQGLEEAIMEQNSHFFTLDKYFYKIFEGFYKPVFENDLTFLPFNLGTYIQKGLDEAQKQQGGEVLKCQVIKEDQYEQLHHMVQKQLYSDQ